MHPTKNTLPDNTRKSSIKALQARLADATDLMTQTKQAHWNVKGPSFIALHELFDQINGEVAGHTDLIAERLVALGGQAYGTARVAAATSTLDEYSLDALGGKLAAARGKMEFQQGLNDGHKLTSGELRARYSYLKSALDEEIVEEEAHGHRLSALEQDVMAWLHSIDLGI